MTSHQPQNKTPTFMHNCTDMDQCLSVCLSLAPFSFLLYCVPYLLFVFKHRPTHTYNEVNETDGRVGSMVGEGGGGVGCCDTSCHGSICAWAKAFWPLPLDFCFPFCGGKGNEGYVWWKGNVYVGLKLCYWRQKWRKRKNKCTNQVCGPSPKKREKRLNRGSERNPKEKLIRILFMEGRGTSCFPHRTLKWLYLL